jgi:hypothetical protein
MDCDIYDQVGFFYKPLLILHLIRMGNLRSVSRMSHAQDENAGLLTKFAFLLLNFLPNSVRI